MLTQLFFFFLSLPCLCRDALKEVVLTYVLQKSLGNFFLCMWNCVRASSLGDGWLLAPHNLTMILRYVFVSHNNICVKFSIFKCILEYCLRSIAEISIESNY